MKGKAAFWIMFTLLVLHAFSFILQSTLTIPANADSYYTLKRTTTCKDVQSSPPYDPIEETDIFRRDDPKVFVWIHLIYVYKSLVGKVEWYDPNDNLYWESSAKVIPDPEGEGKDYWTYFKWTRYIYIDGQGAADLLGQWRAEVYIDGGSGCELVATEHFAIAQRFVIPSVPYHSQFPYYCGPASLEMVFDLYGPDISQEEIADVARTDPPPSYCKGTCQGDMIRAAHFSKLSTSVGDAMPGSIAGYTDRHIGYGAFIHRFETATELKPLIDAGYPIVVLTWFDENKDSGHYRVVIGYVGYDDTILRLVLHDPQIGPDYEMDYETFSELWDSKSSNWGLFVHPWIVSITSPSSIQSGSAFIVTATVTYPCPSPFNPHSYPASLSKATLQLPAGMSLAPGETATKDLNSGSMKGEDVVAVQWNVQANLPNSSYAILVNASGQIIGSTSTHGSSPGYAYTDLVGGLESSIVEVTPCARAPTVSSSTHPDENEWYSNDAPSFSWSEPSDSSGIEGYSYELDDSPSTIPDTSVDTTGNSKSYSNQADGEWWFHVRAKDGAGNWGSTDHYRIKIDTTDASTPSPDDHVEGWSSDDTPTFSWNPSSDSASGVRGYYWKVDSGSETWITSTTISLPSQSDGSHTFYVKAEDNAGNIGIWGSHSFQIDTLSPSAPVVSSPTHPDEETCYSDNDVTFEWTTPSDLSGIVGYSYILDNSSSTTPDETINTVTNSKSCTDIDDGIWCFHIRCRDNAGNWGPSDHYIINIGTLPQPQTFEIEYDNEPFEVTVLMNSTILGFNFNDSLKEISIDISGPEDTMGFCNITIPNGLTQDLWNGSCCILIDGLPPLYEAPLVKNSTHTFLYFTYLLSTHEITIVPEFPFSIILPLFMIATLLAAILYRRKHTNQRHSGEAQSFQSDASGTHSQAQQRCAA